LQVGVRGEQDAYGVRAGVRSAGHEFNAVHAGHLEVRDEDSEGAAHGHDAQGFLAAFGGEEVVFVFEKAAKGFQQVLVVVHQQHPGFAAPCSGTFRFRHAWSPRAWAE